MNVQLAKEVNGAAHVSRRTEPRNECGTLWAQAAAVPKLRSEHATDFEERSVSANCPTYAHLNARAVACLISKNMPPKLSVQ